MDDLVLSLTRRVAATKPVPVRFATSHRTACTTLPRSFLKPTGEKTAPALGAPAPMEAILDCGTGDEAYDLLQNGILVETSGGLVCMSLNDALSSDLNLSEEELKDVAAKLILQQDAAPRAKDRVYLKTSSLNFESDGFSSECSDVSVTSASSAQSTHVAFASATSESKSAGPHQGGMAPFLPCAIDLKNLTQAIKSDVAGSSSVSDSDTGFSAGLVATAAVAGDDIKDPRAAEVHKPPKRRGGWPKGRKRKPELLNLPPKAPATGYNLYLNEQRKLFKDSSLVFHEITKVIGNKWSNLSLEEKRPYLAKAEEDKRRYRDELKQYRQSDAYRAYLAKKRRNRLQNNVLSESDMDATDEIDEEDNEELYCRTCDQWFHNLHNKREHLQGRQHTQSVAGEIKRELDTDRVASANSSAAPLDESTLDRGLDAPPSRLKGDARGATSLVSDCMTNLMSAVTKRETEIKVLERRLQETVLSQNALCQQLSALRQRHGKLKNDLAALKEQERGMEAKVSNLWQVPSWFIITDFNAEPPADFNNASE